MSYNNDSEYNIFLAYLKWSYLKGLYEYNDVTMDEAAYRGYPYIFDICIENGCKPDASTLNNSTNRGIDIFNECLKYSCPTQETMNTAIYRDNIDVVRKCLELGFEVNDETI